MFAPALYTAALDDRVDPQRGEADVPPGARRVRRYSCSCPGCCPPGLPWFGGEYGHDDAFFPVYGPPTPHEPRRMAPA